MPDGRRRRRRKDEGVESGEEISIEGMVRECPVPKPGGIIGRVLGFEKVGTKTNGDSEQEGK